MGKYLNSVERTNALNERKVLLNNNLQTIQTNAGKISFNRKFFLGGYGLSTLSTIGGLALTVFGGVAVMPLVAMGIGAAGIVTNLKFLSDENKAKADLEDEYARNMAAVQQVKRIEKNNTPLRRK